MNQIKFSLAVCAILLSSSANAVIVNWTDWQSQQGTTDVYGQITTPTSTIDVHYNNPQGVAFTQFGSGTDYFRNDLGADGSPYTSDIVENIPTPAEMIGLRWAGSQSLSFSESVSNLFFSYVSLNGNGYAFDQDFDILSFGHPNDGNYCGNWGCGTSYKNIVDLGNGQFEYQLLGTGEPHGTIMFTDAFETVTWRSLSNEYWNGFTVGVQGTTVEVQAAAVPEPSAWLLMAGGLLGLGRVSRQRNTLKSAA
jgi:hypothetical protein